MGIFNILKSNSVVKNYNQEFNINQDTFSLVKEIHNSFDTELDNILAEVKIRHNLKEIEDNLNNKCNQLLSLGFENTPEILEIKKLKDENDEKLKFNNKKEDILNGIKYFQQNYPLYKVITLSSLDKICEKYQLGYAAISAFTGLVPQKNLDTLLTCKIDDNDKALLTDYTYNETIGDRRKKEAYLNLSFQTNSNDYLRGWLKPTQYILAPLIIAAPPKDFIESIQTNKFGKLHPAKNLEDPIVMQPVVYKDNIFMLIITAWGPEASDPEVVNHLMN